MENGNTTDAMDVDALLKKSNNSMPSVSPARRRDSRKNRDRIDIARFLNKPRACLLDVGVPCPPPRQLKKYHVIESWESLLNEDRSAIENCTESTDGATSREYTHGDPEFKSAVSFYIHPLDGKQTRKVLGDPKKQALNSKVQPTSKVSKNSTNPFVAARQLSSESFKLSMLPSKTPCLYIDRYGFFLEQIPSVRKKSSGKKNSISARRRSNEDDTFPQKHLQPLTTSSCSKDKARSHADSVPSTKIPSSTAAQLILPLDGQTSSLPVRWKTWSKARNSDDGSIQCSKDKPKKVSKKATKCKFRGQSSTTVMAECLHEILEDKISLTSEIKSSTKSSNNANCTSLGSGLAKLSISPCELPCLYVDRYGFVLEQPKNIAIKHAGKKDSKYQKRKTSQQQQESAPETAPETAPKKETKAVPTSCDKGRALETKPSPKKSAATAA